eukprot:6184547-Pleurochrysis_carterae.AAC.4
MRGRGAWERLRGWLRSGRIRRSRPCAPGDQTSRSGARSALDSHVPVSSLTLLVPFSAYCVASRHLFPP